MRHQTYAATFPVAGHHRPFTGAKLYRVVTEAHACEQLPKVATWVLCC